MFLEEKFAYAVYDFLEDKKQEGQYLRLRRRYKEFLYILEKIAEEAFFLGEKATTRKILTDIVTDCNNSNAKILNDLEEVFRYYLYLFYR